MSYDVANPPRLMVPARSTDNPQMWAYHDGDPKEDINGADYFTNGVELGMKVGDCLYSFDTAGTGAVHAVQSISGTMLTLGFALNA